MLILACILAGVLETSSPNTFISSASCFGESEQVTADLVVPTLVLTSFLTSVLDASEEMVTFPSMFKSAKLLFELTFSGIGSEKMKSDEGEEVVGGGLAAH